MDSMLWFVIRNLKILIDIRLIGEVYKLYIANHIKFIVIEKRYYL